MGVFGLVAVGNHIGRAGFQLSPIGLQCPHSSSIGANELAVVLNNPSKWELMDPAILDAFVGDPSFCRHFAHETIDAGVPTGPFDAECYAGSNRHNSSDNRRANYSMLRKTKRDRPAGHYLSFELTRRHSF